MTTDLLATFYTQHAAQNGAGKAAGGNKAQGAGGGLLGKTGDMAFMEILFSGLRAESGETSEAEIKLESTIDYDGFVEGHTAPLAIDLQTLAQNTKTAKGEFQITPGMIQTLSNAEPMTSQNLTDIQKNEILGFLETLLAGLPVENKGLLTAKIATDKATNPELLEIFKGLITTADSNTETSDTPPALIATGLTPEEITKFIEELTERTEQGESFMIGLVKILPPEAQKEIIALPHALILAQAKEQTSGGQGQSASPAFDFDTASKLNSLFSDTVTAEGASNNLTNALATDEGLPLESKFERVLDILEQKQQSATENGKNTAGLEKAISNIKSMSAGLSTVPANNSTPPPLNMGLGFASDLASQLFPDGFDWSLNGQALGQIGQSMSVSGSAMMTSLVNHATQASQSHPATNAIAATITKSAGAGENKNITIRLDPPELGRLDVRMSFNKDKSMKAHLVVEKPETFMMVQRDAQILERALQEAGIDTGGDGLSFELAEDGGLFDHDQSNQNSRGGGGSDGTEGDGEENIEIIETTMDLQFDPETGLTRYDFLA